MARILLILILVMIAGALGWSFLGDTDSDLMDDIHVEDQGNRVQNQARRKAVVPQGSFDQEGRRSEAQARSNNTTFESTENLTESNSILVRLVLAGGETPARNAVLSCISKSALQKSLEKNIQFAERGDLPKTLKALGKNYKVPNTGEVRIPDYEGKSYLLAYTRSAMVLEETYATPDTTILLTLSPIIKIQARVFDSRGKVVQGAVVEFGETSDADSLGGSQDLTLSKASTNGSGLATFETTYPLLDQGSGQLFLAVQGLSDSRTIKRFAIDDLPKGVVDLHVNTSASIVLMVNGPDGGTWRGPTSLRIDVVDSGERSSGNAEDWGSPSTVETVFRGGKIKIPFVAPGLRLKFSLVAKGKQELDPIIETRDGPVGVDEELYLDFSFKKNQNTFVGRLLTPDGTPLRDTSVVTSIVESSGGSRFSCGGGCTTDELGRFALPLPNTLQARADKRVILFSVKSSKEGRFMSAALSLPFMEGKLRGDDLGDVLLEFSPTLVSGVVQDGDGKPVAQAQIMLLANVKDLGSQYRFRCQIPAGFPFTSSDGTFEVLGTCEDSDFLVRVNAPGFLEKKVVALKGSTKFVITLERESRILGDLILPKTLRTDDIDAVLVSKDDGSMRLTRIETDGAFAMGYLPPGNYKLDFRIHETESAIHTVEGITLGENESQDLGEIRCDFSGIRIDLERLEPLTISKGKVYVDVFSPGSDERFAQYTMSKKHQSFAIDEPLVDIQVHLVGYRTLTFEKIGNGRIELRMTRGLPIRIEVDDPKNLIPQGIDVVIKLRSSRRFGGRSSEVPREGDVFYVPFPGKYEAYASLTPTSGKYKGFGFGVTLSGGKLNILDSKQEQVFRLKFESADLNRALKVIEEANGR